jgi:hypothetical protein
LAQGALAREGFGVCIQPDAGSDFIAHAGADACALAKRHHRRKPRHGRDGVGDRPEHGTDDVRSDRRLEHRSGDEHGGPALPNGCPRDNGYRKADVQRRHQQVEYSECFEHEAGMRRAVAETCLYYL